MSTTRTPTMVLALVGALSIGLGIALLPSGRGVASTLSGPTAKPSQSTKPTKSPQRPKKHHKHTGTTVIGPKMFNGNTFSPGQFSYHSTVTVSQTTNLTNQIVQVSWTGFTPSGPSGFGVYSDQTSTYPVEVAQCNTPRPRFWSQCYGANAGGLPAQGPFGPQNTAFATTAPNGQGAVDIQILVSAENQFLGCGKDHRCSLVIVPAQGGITGACSNHLTDSVEATGQFEFGGQGQCSWDKRIVIPLTFVQAPRFCPIRNAALSVLGSPMLNLAMQQWIGALCAGSNPVTMTYNPTITEPEAIGDLGAGLGDVALTTRPGPTQIGTKKYAFAPLAISAVAIAYWVDSPVTFQPVTDLKLDPRLVAKLLTQSYNFDGDGCGGGTTPSGGIGCDSAVDGNPPTLFDDPEFRHLNHRVKEPSNATFQVPTVMSGHSDMTWEITKWIASNRDGSAFMTGQFDPWGMHVNTGYLSEHYPVDSFNAQDNYPVISHKYSPAFPLSFVVQLQAENTDNGTDYEIDTTTGNFPKDPVEFPGARSLFAVIDEGDAAALQFPVAKILNAAGKYVAPTQKSMAAALATMTPTGDTEQVNFGKKRAAAYPLTMVIYAMVPTSGVSPTKAAEIASFIRFAVGPGQQRGLNVGQLPPGYLPLPADLRAKALHAADLVATQAGQSKSPSSSPSSSPSASPSAGGAGSSPGAGPSGSPSSSTTPSPGTTPQIVTIALKDAQTAGMARYALPALLILGGLAALGGASSLIASTAGLAVLEPLRRLRRIRRVRVRLTLRRKS